MPRQPDRELRRLIARLAGASPADVEAILDALEPAARARAAALLAEYFGEAATASRPLTVAYERPDVAGALHSPWLAARLAGEETAPTVQRALALALNDAPHVVQRTPFLMTARATEALRQADLKLNPRRAEPPAPPASSTMGLLGRLRQSFEGRFVR